MKFSYIVSGAICFAVGAFFACQPRNFNQASAESAGVVVGPGETQFHCFASIEVTSSANTGNSYLLSGVGKLEGGKFIPTLPSLHLTYFYQNHTIRPEVTSNSSSIRMYSAASAPAYLKGERDDEANYPRFLAEFPLAAMRDRTEQMLAANTVKVVLKSRTVSGKTEFEFSVSQPANGNSTSSNPPAVPQGSYSGQGLCSTF